jgi:predicted DNA-binding transcriptional regulator YafY
VAKLERLLNLAAALLATDRPLTSEQLRIRVPGYPEDRASFRRAFERDKEALRAMGFPLTPETVPGSNPPADGYRIRQDQAFLPDPELEPDELAALHLAASVVKLEGVDGLEAFWKLGGAAPGEPDAGGDAPAVAALPADANLVPLFAGVAERRQVSFGYRGESRLVNPYRLDFQRGRWYLLAYDQVRQDERAFRLDRIEGEVELGPDPGAFERPDGAVPGLRLSPWQLGEEEPTVARVLVDAVQAPSAVLQVGEEALAERRDDGSVVLELAITNVDGFRGFVLALLDHGEVLGPPELREDVVSWLEAMQEAG